MIGFKGRDGAVRFVRRVAFDRWLIVGTTTSTPMQATVDQMVALTHYPEWPTLRSTLLALAIKPAEPAPAPVTAPAIAPIGTGNPPPASNAEQAIAARTLDAILDGKPTDAGNMRRLQLETFTINRVKVWWVASPDRNTGFLCWAPVGGVARSVHVPTHLDYSLAIESLATAVGMLPSEWPRLMVLFEMLRGGV